VSAVATVQNVFKPRERIDMQFRAEIFNLLNRDNFNLPVATVFQSSGAILGSAGTIGSLNRAAPPRQIQFGLKVLS
jgi:hypothetical protein